MYIRNVLLASAAVAALAISGPAWAAATGTGTVNVGITIDPVVSIWGADANLDLNGANAPDNSDAVQSSISYINNVDAHIAASVAGLPVTSNGIQFHIFNNWASPVAALSAIHANAANPAGAISFNGANQGTPQTLVASTGVNTNIYNDPIVYAAGLPNDLPLPGTFTAVVTYTITQN